MNEHEIKQVVEAIKKDTGSLVKLQGSVFRHLLNGILGGFGSVIGFALAIVVIGWILNFIGIIPAFKQEAAKWQDLLQKTQQRQVPVKK
jgi:uncharacterized membrane protein YGL010W